MVCGGTELSFADGEDGVKDGGLPAPAPTAACHELRGGLWYRTRFSLNTRRYQTDQSA